jgi:hypothetical protein
MNKITSIVISHLLLSLQMLNRVVEQCPDSLWINAQENESIWKRILHVLESNDFWLDDFSDYKFMEMFGNISAEMDTTNKSILSKAEISKYLKIINNKIKDYANYINDNNLSEISIKHSKVTYLDIILSQIRHIQINVGYCNEKFKNNGLCGVEWLGTVV